jgi:hypothetical protein
LAWYLQYKSLVAEATDILSRLNRKQRGLPLSNPAHSNILQRNGLAPVVWYAMRTAPSGASAAQSRLTLLPSLAHQRAFHAESGFFSWRKSP